MNWQTRIDKSPRTPEELAQFLIEYPDAINRYNSGIHIKEHEINGTSHRGEYRQFCRICHPEILTWSGMGIGWYKMRSGEIVEIRALPTNGAGDCFAQGWRAVDLSASWHVKGSLRSCGARWDRHTGICLDDDSGQSDIVEEVQYEPES